MAKTSLGAGNVDIELDGETVTLKPTLNAIQTISRQSEGIMGAVHKVGAFDFDMIVMVIGLGLNMTDRRAQRDLAEQVFSTGLADLIEPVTRYLSILANGGRPLPTDEGGEGGADPRKS